MRYRFPALIRPPFIVLLLLLTAAGCSQSRPAQAAVPATSEPATQQSAPATTTRADASPSNPAGPALHINSARTMQYTREIVAIGPRPIASAGHKKVEDYLLAHLRGDQIEEDRFTATTPEGKFAMNNIIAKYPGTKDGIIVIASHYDTNYPLRNTKFVGANDGACTSALLLEFANLLRGKKRDGYSIWLLWTDGEEAVREWSDSDSLYGTKHLAAKWQSDGTAKKIKALFVADMIGDADLNIERDSNSTAWLLDLVFQSATHLGYQSYFFGGVDRNSQLARESGIQDDHLPFARIGVPVADIIDLNYGYNNVFHHTVEDTLDKLSPKSLQIAGDVILETVRQLDQR